MRYTEACEWLQLDPHAEDLDDAQLKRAFRAAAIREHPDKSTHSDSTHRFQQVTRAHRFLLRCVQRGQTGSNAQDLNDDDDEEYDFDEDFDRDEDFFGDDIFFSVHVGPFGEMFIRVHFGGCGDMRGSSDQSSFSASRSSSFSHAASSGSFGSSQQQRTQKQQEEYLRKKRQEEEKEYEEYMARMYKYAKEREEERKRIIQREQERAEYMAERRRQAASEGRSLFEAWGIQQCLGEARRRGLSIKGLQHEQLVELLIQDEAKKRTRRELKQKAPLLDEWAEVHDTKRVDLNKKKVRVVDFYDGMYVVEWDASTGGKKAGGKMRHSKKARIKPEHLQLWGSMAPPSGPAMAGESSPQVEPKVSPSKRAPKMIKLKVKCPKDKKPGDVFEIKNPHALGEKVQVRVPPKTEPGKSFTWLVRAAEATEEPEELTLCAVCSRDLKADKTAIELRSCSHSVCKSCSHHVQGKSCLQCSKPNPTVESLQHLPYLQEMQAPSNVLEALLEEYFCCRESEAAVGGDDAGKKKEGRDHALEKATKAVNRHYRRASVKVHPDRHGEEFRAQFDTLTKARDVMANPTLRRSYLDEMIGIVCKVDLSYIPQSHEIWIQRNDPDAVEQTRKKKAEPGGQEQVFQIDGGVMFSRPKKPGVSILENAEKLVEVFLAVHHEHQFLSYCKQVVIVGSSGDIDEDEIRLGQLSADLINVVDGEICVKLYLPQHSIWDISWYSRMDQGDGHLRDTPRSDEARVDLRSEKQLALMEKVRTFDEMARKRHSDIRAYVGNHSVAQAASSRAEIENRYWALHREISKGRSTESKLRDVLKRVGESSTPALLLLREVLEEALSEKSKIEETCKSYIRRDARKSFKTKVAQIIEAGDAADWIGSVGSDELVSLGGDANRLYQLLVEGKKANSLMLDGAILVATSQRSDLFSAKQCDVLKKRGEELEEQAVIVENRVLEEARRSEEEAKKLREMEAMASLMPRGTFVTIHGLVKQKHLNGTFATYMGIGPNRRYTLRLYGDGREVALKESNFSKWGDSASPVEHAMDNSDDTACKSNQKPKLSDSPEKPRSQPVDSQTQNSHKSPLSPDRSVRTNGGLGKPRKHQPVAPVLIPKPNKEARTPPRQQTRGSQNMTKPQERQQASSASKPTSSPGARQGQARSPRRKASKKLRCRMGAKCRFLRKGPAECNFFHPPEEIATVHPNATNVVASSISPCPTDRKKIQGMDDQNNTKIEGSTLIHSDGIGGLEMDFGEVNMGKNFSLSNPEQLVFPPAVSASPGIIGSGLGMIDQTSLSSWDMPVSEPPRVRNVSVSPPVSQEDRLLSFLSTEETCLKCLPHMFYHWLQSEDILSLTDLADAVSDDEYVNSDMVMHGLKKFKRAAFRKSVVAAAASD